MADVDFGTYHLSTAEESKGIRECAEKAFSKLLRPLYPSGATLRILDAGCGLGFLTQVAAECFPKASITSVDLFRRGSMSELSIEKAAKNMKSLGIDSRTSFLKHDLTKLCRPGSVPERLRRLPRPAVRSGGGGCAASRVLATPTPPSGPVGEYREKKPGENGRAAPGTIGVRHLEQIAVEWLEILIFHALFCHA
jgi:Methyltransferase domain